MTVPLVSILMVARNAAAYIDAAILSAREQTMADIEIVVVDDGSTDDTTKRARAHADRDARVRVLAGPRKGLSAVRNVTLGAAKGRFASILDSDDVLHPRHVEWLVEAQARAGAEICATNMIEFHQNGPNLTTKIFAEDRIWRQKRQIGPEEFIDRGMIGGQGVSLGYLKPLFDLNFVRKTTLRYDENLRIGEDFDFVFRAIISGASYLYLPQPTYYYRRHETSTSHRLQRSDLEALLIATKAYPCIPGDPIASRLKARSNNLEAALAHIDVIAALKTGRLAHAFGLVAARRETWRLTVSSFREAMAKRIGLQAANASRGTALAHDETPTDRLHAMTSALPFAVT
jgi:succinoglycan biosynthesis protein ExoO